MDNSEMEFFLQAPVLYKVTGMIYRTVIHPARPNNAEAKVGFFLEQRRSCHRRDPEGTKFLPSVTDQKAPGPPRKFLCFDREKWSRG